MMTASDIWLFITRNWALCGIAATVTVLVIVPFLVIRKYVRISLNIFTDTEPPLSMSQVKHPKIPGEEIDFYSTDGLRLRGLMLRARDDLPTRGLIVFAPEFKSDRHSCARYCIPLLRAGYDVFSFDFRGHGQSSNEDGYTPRQWPSDREIADVHGALAYAKEWFRQQGRPVQLGFFGISRGAGAGLLAASHDPDVRCFITDGMFSSDAALEHLMKRWAYIFATFRFLYENHPPEFWMFLRWCMVHEAQRKFRCYFPSVRRTLRRAMPRPMLFIHGDRDSYIPSELARVLYAQAPQPRYLWVVPDAKHNQSVEVAPTEYALRTLDFFDCYLSGQTRPQNLYQRGLFAHDFADTPPLLPAAQESAAAFSRARRERHAARRRSTPARLRRTEQLT